MKVLLIEDHEPYRVALEMLADKLYGIRIVSAGTLSLAQEAWDRLKDDPELVAVVVDGTISNDTNRRYPKPNTLELATKIIAHTKRIPVFAFSSDPESVCKLLEVGCLAVEGKEVSCLIRMLQSHLE